MPAMLDAPEAHVEVKAREEETSFLWGSAVGFAASQSVLFGIVAADVRRL
jgi:hypothetical protein